MSYQSEAQLETELVTRLQGLGWASVRLPDETSLYANLRAQLDAHNGITMTDAEFTRVMNHLDKGGVFDRAETLRGKFRLDRVLSIMIEKPGILRRRSAVERVIDGMVRIVETFDEGVDEAGEA